MNEGQARIELLFDEILRTGDTGDAIQTSVTVNYYSDVTFAHLIAGMSAVTTELLHMAARAGLPSEAIDKLASHAQAIRETLATEEIKADQMF